MENRDKIISILNEQDKVLDLILSEQAKIHLCVINKNWINLESAITNMNSLSMNFVALDNERNALISDVSNIFSDSELRTLIFNVKTKLIKSKIENEALSVYLKNARFFIQTILDKCIPQYRNTVYTRNGQIKKSSSSGISVNALF